MASRPLIASAGQSVWRYLGRPVLLVIEVAVYGSTTILTWAVLCTAGWNVRATSLVSGYTYLDAQAHIFPHLIGTCTVQPMAASGCCIVCALSKEGVVFWDCSDDVIRCYLGGVP